MTHLIEKKRQNACWSRQKKWRKYEIERSGTQNNRALI